MRLARLRKAFLGEARQPMDRGGYFVPRVEGLEERWLPAVAVRPLAGFMANTLTAGVNQNALASLGFTINFEGAVTNQVFVNTAGTVSIGNPLPFQDAGVFPTTLGIPILAAFYADVDNTSTGTITYGTSIIGGHQAFGVIWGSGTTNTGVDYFDSTAAGHVIKQNIFQLIIINRSDLGAGNFDVELNYNQIQWDSSDDMGGTNGLAGAGAHSATVGFTNGTSAPGTVFVLPGSDSDNDFIDTTGVLALTSHMRAATTLGRYHFFFRSGQLVSNNFEVSTQTRVFLPFRYICDPVTHLFRGNATILNTNFDLHEAIVTAELLDEPIPGIPGIPDRTNFTLVFTNLPKGIILANATGVTASGFPFITETTPFRFPRNSIVRIPLKFLDPGHLPLSTFFGGQFKTMVFIGPFDPTML
jgi:hypothetical protein